tara:strand:+ start:381 stop:1106 length:726 start_codon:yes stop_codon:yes gene_type:complete
MSTIIAISGRKQSGKTTIGNFFISLFLSNMGISKEIKIEDSGDIILSDLYGNELYNKITPRYELEKDFVISNLYKELDQHIKIYNFADTLKQNVCMDVLGMSYQQCYGSDEDKNSMTGLYWENQELSAREVMQFIGTDIFRKVKRTVWIDSIMSQITKEKAKMAIITDCRFPDEVDAVKNAGGYVIRLTRDLHNSSHISETALDEDNYDWNNFDYVLDNQHLTIYEQSLQIQEWLDTLPST